MIRIPLLGAWLVLTTAEGASNDAWEDAGLLQLRPGKPPIRFSIVETSSVITLKSHSMITLDTACYHHPWAQFDLYMQKGTRAGIDRSVVEALAEVNCTVKEIGYDPHSFFKGTPFEAFAAANMTKLLKGHHSKPMITKLVGMAAMWKNGGWFLDTDVMVLRNLTNLHNVAGYQACDGNKVDGEVIQVKKHAPFLKHMASVLPESFDVSERDSMGTRLLTAAWKTYQGRDFSVLQCLSFYPVPPGKPRFVVGIPMEKQDAIDRLLHSYTLHVWNSKNEEYAIHPHSLFKWTYEEHCVVCTVVNVTMTTKKIRKRGHISPHPFPALP